MAFCNEPFLRSSTILSVGFHFVSMPLYIFSFSPCAVNMLSCRTSRKKNHKKCSLSLAPVVGVSIHFPFQTFRLEMCRMFRRFHSWTRSVVFPRTDALSRQGYKTQPLHILYLDANRLGFTVSTLRGVCSSCQSGLWIVSLHQTFLLLFSDPQKTMILFP